MPISRLVGALAVALVVMSHAAVAASVAVGSLTLSGFWTTATPPGAPTASAYLTITNSGSTADSLVAVSSSSASLGMLHRMDLANDIASMVMVAAIAIPPGKTVTLAPDRFHIMFVTLKQPLKAGDMLPVTLVFANAGRVDVALPVLAIGARGPPQP
jgi:copper(I)-binding protein